MLYEVRATMYCEYLIDADNEEDARREIERKLQYAEIDPFEIRDWEIDDIIEIEEEDE